MGYKIVAYAKTTERKLIQAQAINAITKIIGKPKSKLNMFISPK